MALRTTLLAGVFLFSSVTIAAAQPSAVTQPAPSAQPAVVPQSAPAIQPAPAAQPALPTSDGAPQNESRAQQILRRFTFGFQLVTGDLDSGDTPNASAESLNGWGVFARFRINSRWEVELGTRKLNVTLAGNNRKRTLSPITASGIVHVVDLYGVELYGRGGYGRGGEKAKSGNTNLDFTTSHIHVGAGAQYQVWNNIGVIGELRYVRVSRQEHGLVASGVHMGLSASYRF